MTAVRRLQRELTEVLEEKSKIFRDVKLKSGNILEWNALLVPDKPPYNRAAYRVELHFTEQYPFSPPKIIFKTKIYHPNIDENGQVCLQIINNGMWKPATKLYNVIQALIALIEEPEPEHPLRPNLAEEYVNDRKKFLKMAADFASKYGEKRPVN